MKRFAKPIALLGSAILLTLLIAAAFIWSTLPKLTEDRLVLPHNVVGINTGFAYAWMIPAEHGLILIDAGHDQTGQALRQELAAQGLTETDVQAIILTHGHTDHWGGTAVFPDATIYIHEADVPMLRGELPESTNPLLAFFQKMMTRNLQPPTSYKTLTGNQTLLLDGEHLDIITTPGHTPGSIAIQWHDILFLGDAIQQGDTGITMPPEMLGGNHTQIKESLQQLLDRDFSVIAVAHSLPIENGYEQLKQFINQP